MSYKTFEIINGELFINEPTDIDKDAIHNILLEDDDNMFMEDDEPEYGSDLIDIGLDD